jgi:hypothetical protein
MAIAKELDGAGGRWTLGKDEKIQRVMLSVSRHRDQVSA